MRIHIKIVDYNDVVFHDQNCRRMNSFAASAPALTVIANRSLVLKEQPFRHIILDNFFTPDFYRALCNAFQRQIDAGIAETFTLQKFSRFSHYDAYYWTLPPQSGWPLTFFYTPAWRDYFSAMFHVPLTDDVNAEFQHHLVNSQSGFVHNDYNPAFFPDRPADGKMNPFYYQCAYYGKAAQQGVRERVRSIAIIYYMNNPLWSEGDGGETGLYDHSSASVPVQRVAPINNRLLAFACSPDSPHGFLQNRRSVRNSFNMWFHGDKATAMTRFGGAIPRLRAAATL